MAWYNGYSDSERHRKGKAVKLGRRNGALPTYIGPCMLCGDPKVAVEPHSEDYSEPYRWEPPALYWLCRHCHRDKLHKRFARPELWKAFLAHVRRGGYARDLADPAIRREFRKFRAAQARGERAILRTLNTDRKLPSSPWWERLTLDTKSRTDSAYRPRP